MQTKLNFPKVCVAVHGAAEDVSRIPSKAVMSTPAEDTAAVVAAASKAMADPIEAVPWAHHHSCTVVDRGGPAMCQAWTILSTHTHTMTHTTVPAIVTAHHITAQDLIIEVHQDTIAAVVASVAAIHLVTDKAHQRVSTLVTS